MPTSRSVAMRVEPSSGPATSLRFWRIGLGLRAGATPETAPNAVSNPLRLHNAFMPVASLLVLVLAPTAGSVPLPHEEETYTSSPPSKRRRHAVDNSGRPRRSPC